MRYLLIDSREKAKTIAPIIDYFDSVGIAYESTKLLFGDYRDYGRPDLVIDRKHNIAELAKNCTDTATKDKSGRTEVERFKAELERAKKAGATLVLLIEQDRYKDRDEWIHVKDISDLMMWASPHAKVRGEKVYRVLASWMAKYPLRVEFCDKRSTGRRILEIIYGEV